MLIYNVCLLLTRYINNICNKHVNCKVNNNLQLQYWYRKYFQDYYNFQFSRMYFYIADLQLQRYYKLLKNKIT